EQTNLIADFSKPYCLPLIERGKHSDLKAITHQTLVDVLRGGYSEVVGRYTIVDCRYPYEYEGGHIKGAINLYTKQAVINELMYNSNEYLSRERNKRSIIIFHCEFSSERGPKMNRYLRNRDREANGDNYPQLVYPEIYLLEHGYKEFFQHHRCHCTPASYVPMLDERY
ncbi:hypothetical protein HELRODRAFT_143032, partial [Helobdella robusta]|uniref:M-phase inducer phosphatase n=1 Tax=Helobdella robusta TaxID=6412 RepID=T1EJ87_HELRO